MKTIILIAIILFISMNLNAYSLHHTKNGGNVRWSQYVVEIVLDDSMLKIGKKKDIEFIIEDALDLWIFDANLPLSFELIWSECDKIDNDGNNCIVACYDGWEFECNRKAYKVATTYITTSTSGRIKDVDIVINIDDWNFSLDCKNIDGLCFQRTIAHEFGHMFGIAHSDDRDAIMYKFMSIDDDEVENLFLDDIEAVRFLYSNFIINNQEYYEVACSSSVIGFFYRSDEIFDLLSLFLWGL